MRKCLVVVLLILLTLSASGRDLRAIFAPYNITSEDQLSLGGSLLAAVNSVTVYKDRALGPDEPLPSAVGGFFSKTRSVAQRYEISGDDILAAISVAVGSSGRIPSATADGAFKPLSNLLRRHKVSGVATLDMVTPALLEGMTDLLRTPPSERARFNYPKPSPAQVSRVAKFAKQYGIPLPKLMDAMRSLRRLRPD